MFFRVLQALGREHHREPCHQLAGELRPRPDQLLRDRGGREVCGLDQPLARRRGYDPLERQLRLVGDDPQDAVALPAGKLDRSASRQGEHVACAPLDGVVPLHRAAGPFDHIGEHYGCAGFDLQRFAGSHTRVRREDQRRCCRKGKLELGALIARDQRSAGRGIERCIALCDEARRRHVRVDDVEGVPRIEVARAARVGRLRNGLALRWCLCYRVHGACHCPILPIADLACLTLPIHGMLELPSARAGI